jgi:hypothetical protein
LKAVTVEEAMAEDVSVTVGDQFPPRFIPYVMMHEFEAMLFSDCESFCHAIGTPHLRNGFQQIREGFGSPEEINDSPLTAPSKRIISLIPGYEKPLAGSIAAINIGIHTIRAQCPNFNKWLTRLERLGTTPESAV